MLIPEQIPETESQGEKIIFNKFRQEPPSRYYVLHSLFINAHLTSVSGELDFLVLAPGEGIFALEVKHGRVSRNNGIWTFTNRFGRSDTSTKGPFRQVSDTMHSVRKLVLEKTVGRQIEHARFSKILFGTGILFTGLIDAPEFGAEGFSWQVFTRKELPFPIGNFLSRLSHGWHTQYSGTTWYDASASRPSDLECRKLVSLLRGDFEVTYTEINKITDQESLIESYTEEQFHLLDFVNYNKRSVIQGAAGTGKTLMALELARRCVSQSLNVGLFCYNAMLGAKLTADLAVLSGTDGQAHSGSLHSYMLAHTTTKVPESPDHEFFSEVLPMEFLIENELKPESDKFDVLIVDEAQDLMSPFYREVLFSMLKGGAGGGNWIMFGDFCAQSIFEKDAESIIFTLAENSSFVRFPPLMVNCRNTKKIVIQNTLLSGADQPEIRSLGHEEENIHTRWVSKRELSETVSETIRKLAEGGIPLKKIVILSPFTFAKTFAEPDAYLKGLVNANSTLFCTIQSFKGLENAVVILTGFDQLLTDEAQRLLYVGISRAKLRLYLIFDKHLKRQFSSLVSANSKKIKL
ncbi:NERD domain-containing protein [Pedobacter sp. MC2016-05]|uniref:nuclease-related domain-containing DEAD/DEAH box helicase n=1 Tax=Pedobacter sp. MC2016-05 TaxID=2994474 RepID=UPI002248124E|nr:NERD domain-containing protein [Pedobacter sp. MC2016-05]MCX2476086.1 NERD domain-containing protein [Pedobacter sp. MC2016-05]